MKCHECMHLGGQQQFHAALSLIMHEVCFVNTKCNTGSIQ